MSICLRCTYNVAILELHKLGGAFVLVHCVVVGNDAFSIYRGLFQWSTMCYKREPWQWLADAPRRNILMLQRRTFGWASFVLLVAAFWQRICDGEAKGTDRVRDGITVLLVFWVAGF